MLGLWQRRNRMLLDAVRQPRPRLGGRQNRNPPDNTKRRAIYQRLPGDRLPAASEGGTEKAVEEMIPGG